tara:strand:- start:3834 stop:4856 length:1023 start_codon:yes stop_codon:yes gene_type:complete
MIFFNILVLLHGLFYRVKSKAVLLFSFSILFVVSAYRASSVGSDTGSYLNHFNIVKSGSSLWREYLWVELNKLVVDFNGEFSDILIISHCLILIPIFLIAYKKSKFPLLVIYYYLAFYFYFYSMNIMRQCIAVSLALVIYVIIDSKIKYKYLLASALLTIAVLFHTSAIIVLVIFLFHYLIRINIKYLYLILVGSMIIGISFSSNFTPLIEIMGYEKLYENTDEFTLPIVSILNTFVLNFILVVITNIIDKKNMFFYLFLSYVILSNLLIFLEFSNRILMYGGIIRILLFPSLIYNNRLDVNQKSFGAIFFAFYAYLYFNLVLGSGNLFPYKNVLFEEFF